MAHDKAIEVLSAQGDWSKADIDTARTNAKAVVAEWTFNEKTQSTLKTIEESTSSPRLFNMMWNMCLHGNKFLRK